MSTRAVSMNEATAVRPKQRLARKVLPILMALMMVFTMGVMPAGESHAASIPTINYAKLPSAYSSGYNVYKCMDISNWQGALTVSQFKKLKKKYDITHVIVRVGYTRWASFLRFADASYEKNITNAAAAGLKVGAYYYSQAKTKKEAKKEAKKTIKLLKPYKSLITLPVAFDYEFEGRLKSRKSSKLKSQNAAICSVFCDTIKSAGYDPMVYASTYQLNTFLNTKALEKKYKIWAANFMRKTSHTTSYKGEMYAWQYSDSGRFGKALTNTDRVDLSYIFIKKNGKWVYYSDGKVKYKMDGVFLKNEWLTLDGKKYYFDAQGYRLTDCYQKIGAYYYGFDPDGVMYKKTTAVIDGKQYKFLSNGKSVLFVAKVVNVSDGKLAYRTKASLTKGYTVGYYAINEKIKIVRKKGDWVQAKNGYWTLSLEDGCEYLKTTKTFPVEVTE